MINTFYTYIHLRADDDIVFYVGQGRGQRAYVLSWHNKYWHSTVAKHGYYVKLVKTDLTKDEAASNEIELIAYYRKVSGLKLTNMTSGGDGGMLDYKHTDAAKKKIGEASKGNKHGIGNQNRLGIPHSEEAKQKIRDKRALQVPNRIGQSPSEETREKIRLARLGTKMSVESSDKKRIAATGRVMSHEAIAKSVSKRIGKQRTPEQREKMRQAQLLVTRKKIKTEEELITYKEFRNKQKRESRLRLKNKLQPSIRMFYSA